MIYEILNEKDFKQAAKIAQNALGENNAEAVFLKEKENKISAYFAAKEGGELLGYCGVWNICGEAEIISIAVKENYRRKGVATGLFAEAEKFLKKENVRLINLEVRESNLAAQKLYKKLGFLPVSERKRYYEGKETAVLMTKRLKEE